MTISVPLLNPLRFVPIADGGRHFDDDWDRIIQKSWQISRGYCQKLQWGDRIVVLYRFPLQVPVKLWDCHGREVGPLSSVQDLLGVKVYGAIVPQIEGEYYVTIGNYYISEPLLIREKWDNTALIEYSNYRNDFGIPFGGGQVHPELGFRVEANLVEFTPLSENEMYTDQVRNNVQLHSTPYRRWKLVIGGRSGVPDWVGDKMNRIFACSEVWIDGKKFTRNGDAVMETQRVDNYNPFASYSLEVTEAENTDSMSVETGVQAFLGTSYNNNNILVKTTNVPIKI